MQSAENLIDNAQETCTSMLLIKTLKARMTEFQTMEILEIGQKLAEEEMQTQELALQGTAPKNR